NDYNDFYIGLWWGFFLLAVCLGTIFINNTFFDTATMYTKLGHGNVAIIVSLLWFVYLCLEVVVIFRYNKLSKLLYDNQDK
ncbi:MAG: hypothetical protein LBU51_08070, partial [Bacteroidales bacterium]|nr:hypothetical protein [Bacteroidales bacterium]